MPTGRGHASALLSKVNSQLRGERVPLKTKEEDELAIYLNAINAKTQQVQSANFEDVGDISISSGKDGFPAAHRSASQAGITPSHAASKFLKKKSQPAGDVESQIIIAGRKKDDASPTRPGRSSAINKFNALSSKIQGRRDGGLRRSTSRDSDSESEAGRRPGSDTSVGRDGRKFLKGRKTLNEDGQADRENHSPQPRQRNRSLEKKERPSKTGSAGGINKGEIARTLGNVYLTSEEESLAEFIQGLSVSDSVAKRPQNLVAKKQQKWRKKTPSRQSPSPVRSRSPSPYKRTPSPFAGKVSRSASQDQDSDMMDSMASEMVDHPHTRQDSASSDDPLNINLMDVTSLVAVSQPKKTTKQQKSSVGRSRQKAGVQASTSTSLFKASSESLIKPSKSLKEVKKKSVKKSESRSSVLESLGIMMVDDLLPANPVESDVSEIMTERSDGPPARQDSSQSEIITLLGDQPRKTRPPSPETERSLSPPSEHLSHRSDHKPAISYNSESAQDSATHDDYSDSFESDSKTATLSQTVTRNTSHRSRSKRKSRHPASNTESYSRRDQRKHKVLLEQREVSVTQGDGAGGAHQWGTRHTGVTVSGAWGLQYTDPAPVATHVISADALETLTSYSPSMLALHDMMKTQIELVRNFADIQKRIYHSCLDGIKEDYTYTTLEDTKEYIQKNRKKKMTFEEALKLVEQEEGLRA